MSVFKKIKQKIVGWWNDYQLNRKYKKRLKEIQGRDPYNYD